MDNCIFCKIVDGRIPSKFLWQDENVVAFPDIQPQAPVHVLIVPRRHVVTFGDIDAQTTPMLASMARAVREVAASLGVDKTGYRLIVNNGHDAHQEVLHLHMHLFGGQALGPMLKKSKAEG